MWISKNIAENTGSENIAMTGSIGGSIDLRVSAASGDGTGRCAMILPPGVISLPERDEEAVMLHTRSGSLCIGVKKGYYGGNIEPGETIICSSGGAEIKLTQNGEIHIFCDKIFINEQEVHNGS